MPPWKHLLFTIISAIVQLNAKGESSLPYVWPLPAKYVSGSQVLSVDNSLSLVTSGPGGESEIINSAFLRYKKIIFKHAASTLRLYGKENQSTYDITKLKINVQSNNEELQLGVDESYTLFAATNNESSIIDEVSIDAKTVYGAIRGLETLSQLCIFNFATKKVEIHDAPLYIEDHPRFPYRGLLIDSSRHFLPIDVIKGIIESMSYAKLNVLHWHIIDEQAFPMEVPSHPKLWDGSYTKWERYTVEDAREIVKFARMRGVNVMAEVDVPGHGESWGVGYPDLWPSPSCREPLDVSKPFTFDVLDGILADFRKIFPFELFHLGGDEVNTSCWDSSEHIREWMEERNTTAEGAYRYFVLEAQKLAISKEWTPVNWEETFTNFGRRLNPETVVHNWLRDGVCKEAVAEGFKCIYSNQRSWYLDHLDVPWERVYGEEPLEGIEKASEQALVIGGEVCMWGETADASVVQQTIWPRAAAAAERLWTNREATSTGDAARTALPRLHVFRCLLTQRRVPAAPVGNLYARQPPIGPASCFFQ